MTNTTEKRVSFKRTVRGVAVKSIYEYSPKEIKACWYNVEELDKIAERCIKILHHFENGKTKKGQRYCIRGLESHSTMGSISRAEIRSAALKAVLEEQSRQLKENQEINELSIADAYQRISASSQMRAQVMGALDHSVVAAKESKEFNMGIPAPPSLKVTPSPDMSIRRKTHGIVRVQQGARAA